MFNIMMDWHLTPHRMGPALINSSEVVLGEPGVSDWNRINIYNWLDLCEYHDNYGGKIILSHDIRSWLNNHAGPDWRYYYGIIENRRCLCFLFKNIDIAMLFKLTFSR